MVDPDIQTAIDIIDKKIQSLQQARNQLALAFGLVDQGPSIVESRHPQKKQNSVDAKALPSPISVPVATKPRKEALAEFLIEHGPMPRADILSKAGLPEGTISYCLNDKRFFEQLPNGDWAATEFSKKGFEMKAHEDLSQARTN